VRGVHYRLASFGIEGDAVWIDDDLGHNSSLTVRAAGGW
jgi:hypothetical protein